MMDVWELLAAMDREMMLMDANLMDWQGHLDMVAIACLDMTVYKTETQLELPIPLTVKRVPIVRYNLGERIVIGMAELDEQENVIKATVDTDDAEILALANRDAFHLVDEDPPVLNHTEIKAQLRELIHPHMYRNTFAEGKFDWRKHLDERTHQKLIDEMELPTQQPTGFKAKLNEMWQDVYDYLPDNNLDEHPFFRGDDMIAKPLPHGEHIQTFYPKEEQ